MRCFFPDRGIQKERMKVSQESRKNWKKTFFFIWSGQKLSWIGSGLAGFALIWWLTNREGSATVLAIGSLLSMLPAILFGPLAGALVDRWNRRRVMLIADSAIALASAGLAYLFLIDALQVWHVYAIMVARALGSTFHDPAIHASTSLLVPEEHLPRIQGLNSALSGVVSIVSPPLGALLVSLLPLHEIMAIDVLSATFAILPLLAIDIPQPQRPAPSAGDRAKPSVWADMREGLRYVWSWPGLRALLALPALLKITLIPAISLTPVLVTQHFQRDAVHLGWMNAMWGLGLVIGGLALSTWGGFRRRIVTSMLAVVGLGLGTLVVGLSPSTAFEVGLGGMLFVGTMIAFADGPLMALLQTVVPPDKQGRVFTVVMSVANLATPLGLAIAGPISDKLGIHVLYILSGVACIATALAGLLTPAVMHIEENHEQAKRGALAVVEAAASAPRR
jgi:DHA3 family macrolide efflux protein-like MFS transporter